MELSVQTKTYLVLGIMVCCFAVLYPKIFHPMIMAGLGMRQAQPAGAGGAPDGEPGDGAHPRLRRPPHMHSPGSGGGGGGPGPRMAAEHAAQQRQQAGGGGKGNVVGLILPVYAVGIVLYLIYTLVKVMGGFKSGKPGRRGADAAKAAAGGASADYYKNFHFDPLSGDFVDRGGASVRGGGGGGDEEDDGDAPVVEQTRYERMHRDLEKLLKRVDDQDISEPELVQLRGRLEETERQMSTILSAMQSIQQRQAAPPAPPLAEDPPQRPAVAAAAEEAADAETRQRRAFSLQE